MESFARFQSPVGGGSSFGSFPPLAQDSPAASAPATLPTCQTRVSREQGATTTASSTTTSSSTLALPLPAGPVIAGSAFDGGGRGAAAFSTYAAVSGGGVGGMDSVNTCGFFGGLGASLGPLGSAMYSFGNGFPSGPGCASGENTPAVPKHAERREPPTFERGGHSNGQVGFFELQSGNNNCGAGLNLTAPVDLTSTQNGPCRLQLPPEQQSPFLISLQTPTHSCSTTTTNSNSLQRFGLAPAAGSCGGVVPCWEWGAGCRGHRQEVVYQQCRPANKLKRGRSSMDTTSTTPLSQLSASSSQGMITVPGSFSASHTHPNTELRGCSQGAKRRREI